MGVRIPVGRGDFKGRRGGPLQSVGTLCGEQCKNGWADRDAVLDLDSGGPNESCIRRGSWSRSLHVEQFLGKRRCPGMSDDTLRWAVQNGWTDQDAVWVVDSGGSKEARMRWDAHWRHLANITELFVCGGDGPFCRITLTTCYYCLFVTKAEH